MKRKAKFNILDLAIVLAIICAVAVLGFRHYIVEFFDEPNIVKTSATVTLSGVNEEVGLKFNQDDTVEFYPDSDADEKVSATVKSITFNKNNTATVELEFKGYTKFGRIFLEKGEQIRQGSDYVVTKGKDSYKCDVRTVKTN